MLKVILFIIIIGFAAIHVNGTEPCVAADDCMQKFYSEARAANNPDTLCHFLNEALECLELSKLRCEFSQNAWINHKIEDLHRNHPTCGTSVLLVQPMLLIVGLLFSTLQILF